MNVKLTDDQWQKILPILKTFPEIRLGAGRDVRRFLEAVLWITRSGARVATIAEILRQMELRFIDDSTGGVIRASLKNCSHISPVTAIWNIC